MLGRNLVNLTLKPRVGLKPLQLMQLHWAPCLRGPRAMTFGRLLIFARYYLHTRIGEGLTNIIVKN